MAVERVRRHAMLDLDQRAEIHSQVGQAQRSREESRRERAQTIPAQVPAAEKHAAPRGKRASQGVS